MPDLDYIFNTLLAQTLKDYERRGGQLEMAYRVKDALDKDDILMAEAGTGIGKSLAYLIPTILWLGKDKKIVISTYTKTLQNQLLVSDIPLAKSVLGSTIVANLAFGSENYLCRRRFKKLLTEGAFLPFQHNEVESLVVWQKTTRTGLRSEAESHSRISIWRDVCRGQNTCIGKICNEMNCYYEYARRKLYSSQIIITNHHLFFANLSCGGRIFPKYDAVIFDEAHNLEDIATSHLGETVTNFMFIYLLQEIKGCHINGIESLIKGVSEASEDFFEAIKRKYPISITRIKQSINVQTDILFNKIESLYKTLSNVTIEDEEKKAELDNLTGRLKELNTNLLNFLSLKNLDNVYWIEIDKKRITLRSAPIDISDSLSSSVFCGDIPVTLCSATMTTNPNDFSYFSEHLGIRKGMGISLSSPFDYKNNSILYTPQDGPDPRANNYSEFIVNETENLINITGGGTFLLFTSYKLMGDVYDQLSLRLPEYNLLKQGDFSRNILLERFIREKRSILLGASTFWQGVDIPGDSLISVIITKLPFEVPTEPIEEARIERLTEEGRNAFLSYQLPNAILSLKQGFGRLIRKKTDYGLIAILDTRIKKRYYGKYFLSAMPGSKQVSSIEEVREFFMLKSESRDKLLPEKTSIAKG